MKAANNISELWGFGDTLMLRKGKAFYFLVKSQVKLTSTGVTLSKFES